MWAALERAPAAADVVPVGAVGDDVSPCFGFAAKTVAQRSPLIVGHGGALPTGVPVGVGPRIRFARRPAVQEREAVVNVIDMRGDRRLSRHRSRRGGARVDRFELAQADRDRPG